MSDRPRYVIINDTDAAVPSMVCQWVPRVGYCYMDRRGGKERFDGMRGAEATSLKAFGWEWAEDDDGITRFYPTESAPTATYHDGMPRRWQHSADYFEWSRVSAPRSRSGCPRA